MISTDVIELYLSLRDLGIQIWIDGGWGVDALLGRQTRIHNDLDIVVQEKDLPKFRGFLETREYKEIKLEKADSWNFVLGDDKGHEIDVHAVILDNKSNGIYGPAENGQMYPADSLNGSGIMDGIPVKCISSEWMVKFHSGYELKEKDFKDISSLCKKFGISMPKEFDRFRKAKQ